uniref:Uncharacterized protein n=1 Tax=Acrobeloides nanus TaxID=290746 RepID=A0A914BUE5_9BILA
MSAIGEVDKEVACTIWQVKQRWACSYVANAEIVYPYNIGDINATCPDNATCYNNATCPGWQKFGTHCFLLINQSLPFSDANNFCLSPDNGPSVAYRIDNWFLTRTIVENYAQLQSLDGHVAFWTGFYLVKSSNNLLPQYINRTSAINSTSIYNPLWAWTEPDLDFVEIQYANSSNISCIAMDIDLNNETNYGWKLHDCNDRLPFICQTFICYDDDFRCKDNSGCIPRTAVCDNFTDCQDRSDEQNCKHDYCDCGALIHRDHYSQIYSPGFNGPCNKKVQCDYQIIQNPGTHIRLNFISLDLSKDDTLIIEGIDSDEQFPLTSQKSFTYLTSGSRIRIRFSHSSGNGFQLQYFVEDVDSCIRRFESWNGTFSPPRQLPENGHYKNSLDCIWTIANKENGFIGLQIPTFELAITDWLVIYDGMPSQRNIFGNFTCFNPPPTAFATDAAVVNFRFYSAPSSVGDDGFQVTFKQSCLNERLTSSYGVIESPNFRTPSKRTPFHCSWIIQVPHQEGLSGCEFSVFFDNLNLTNKDWITVESGSELITIDAFSLPILMHRAKTPRLMIDMFAETWQFASKISYSIDCQPPMLNDPYTVMTYTEPNRFAYRSTVSFHCFPGYTLSGYSVIQCQLGGKWSLPVPSCLTSVCVVTNITNGYIASLNRTLGVMTWGCLNGYFPDELFQSTCNNSVWVPPPECLGR